MIEFYILLRQLARGAISTYDFFYEKRVIAQNNSISLSKQGAILYQDPGNKSQREMALGMLEIFTKHAVSLEWIDDPSKQDIQRVFREPSYKYIGIFGTSRFLFLDPAFLFENMPIPRKEILFLANESNEFFAREYLPYVTSPDKLFFNPSS